MLKRFKVTNYRGFKQPLCWDLGYFCEEYDYNQYAIENGIIKSGMIYGRNSSGKTSLSLAVFDIVNHLSQTWKKPDYYSNFAYVGNPDQPVEFEYRFVFDAYNLLYVYSKDNQGRLITERLDVNDQTIFNRKPSSLSILKTFDIPSNVSDMIVSGGNNISVINFLLTSKPWPQDHYLIRLRDFVNGMLWFHGREIPAFIGLDTGPSVINKFINNNGLLKDFEKFLRDVGKIDYKLSSNGDDEIIYCIIEGKKVSFDKIASTGTEELKLLYFWIKHMDNASFVMIDEFDAFYHFKLSYDICKVLFKLSCQMFLTTHNTTLMTNDLLRPDCYFLIRNNELKPLSSLTEKDLRYGLNLEKLYRGDTFGL